jgi:hypothetical protein
VGKMVSGYIEFKFTGLTATPYTKFKTTALIPSGCGENENNCFDTLN